MALALSGHQQKTFALLGTGGPSGVLAYTLALKNVISREESPLKPSQCHWFLDDSFATSHFSHCTPEGSGARGLHHP